MTSIVRASGIQVGEVVIVADRSFCVTFAPRPDCGIIWMKGVDIATGRPKALPYYAHELVTVDDEASALHMVMET